MMLQCKWAMLLRTCFTTNKGPHWAKTLQSTISLLKFLEKYYSLSYQLFHCVIASTVVGVSFQQSEYTSSESTPVRVCVLITDGSVQRNVVFSITGRDNGSATGNPGMPCACNSVVRKLSISVLRMCCYKSLHMQYVRLHIETCRQLV